MQRLTRRIATLLSALALLVLPVACGSEDGENESPGGGATTEQTTTSEETTEEDPGEETTEETP